MVCKLAQTGGIQVRSAKSSSTRIALYSYHHKKADVKIIETSASFLQGILKNQRINPVYLFFNRSISATKQIAI